MNFLAILGITNAYAADTAAASPQQGILSMLPLFLIIVLFMYFMVIRPQAKRAKDQKNLMSSLQKGDEVITSGGILGKIENINDNFIILSLGKDVNVTIQKSAIVACVPRGTIKSAE